MTDTTTDALTLSGTPASFYPTGVAMTFTPVASGGVGTLTYSLTGSALPAGLELDPSTGIISGTPSVAGSVATVLKVVDETTSKLLPLVLNVVEQVGTVGTLPTGIEGVPYNETLAVSGGSGALVVKSVGENAPSWLTITASPNGVNFSGTPTTTGVTSFGITLSDDYGAKLSTVSLTIDAVLTLSYAKESVTVAAGEAVTDTATALGGTGAYTYTATGLPDGVVIDATTGALTGTPTVDGSFSIVSTVTSGSQTATATVVVNVVTPITLSYPPINTVQGLATSISPVVSGGSGTRTYTIAASSTSSIPTGLTIDSTTGVISGKPLVSVNETFSITVTDALGSATADVTTLIVTPISILGTLSPVSVGSAISFIPTVSGGDAERYVFSMISAEPLPSGIAFNTVTGALTGTCNTEVDEQEIVISVTDGIQTARLTVALRVLTLAHFTDNQVATFVLGTAGVYSITSTGFGTSPIYSILTGSLPAGLKLGTTSGVISGTPVESGTTALGVKGIGPVNTDTTTITITVLTSVGISGTAPTGTVGMAYAFKPSVTGGGGNLTFSLTTNRSNNTLPDGLIFSTTTGAITGTPTSSDSVIAAITVTDTHTTSVLSNIAINIMSVQDSTAPGASDIYVQQRLAAYVALLSKPRVTTSAYENAMRIMADITNTIIKHPTTTSFGYLYDAHVKYKNTFFNELNFFIGCEVLSSTDMTKISTIYGGYRELTTTPKTTYNFRNIGLSPVNCSALMVWMENKRKIILATL